MPTDTYRSVEIPSAIQKLYRHFSHHTQVRSQQDFAGDRAVFDQVGEFVRERMRIWQHKVQGDSLPYTQDPILAQYRFCNIFREFDRQTIAFHTMLNPLRDDFSLWLLNMFACRLIARPETMEAVGLLSFSQKENVLWRERLEQLPRPKYGTPYVFPISTIQRSATPTREQFLSEYVPHVIPHIAAVIATWHKKSVYDGVQEILAIFGYQLAFLWTEVLIDVAYQYPDKIDLFARFPVGPGALPTIRRLLPHLDPSLAVEQLARVSCEPLVTFNDSPLFLSAENWEGICCEFRKYTNLRTGKGRKRVYRS